MKTAAARIHSPRHADLAERMEYQVSVQQMLKDAGQSAVMTQDELTAMQDAFYSDILPWQFARVVLQARA